jgi:lipopolysaccharide transport system permease protein
MAGKRMTKSEFVAAVAKSSGLEKKQAVAALNVLYRDVRYVVPFLTQIWLFSTPIVYPSSLVPERWQVLYSLNPMVGVVEGFRWALLDTGTAPGLKVGLSALVALVALVSGAFFSRRMEKMFADVV